MAPLPATALPSGRGLLRVVSPTELTTAQDQVDTDAANQNDAAKSREGWENSLVGFIEGEFSRFARHRDGGSGWTSRITIAMEAFKGVYPAWKLAEIKKFGGSQVYARIVATKCRGASSLLRDVYLNTEKPWGLEATPDPVLPDDMIAAIQDLVNTEVQNQQRLAGVPPDAEQIRDRVTALVTSAKQAAIKKARHEAEQSQAKVDDILVEGRFYEALAAFLTDLPLFPFACIKGPVVRDRPAGDLGSRARRVLRQARRCSGTGCQPYDIWWTPGVTNIADAAVIERSRVSRADLNQLIGLPGYNRRCHPEGPQGLREERIRRGDRGLYRGARPAPRPRKS